MADTYVKHRPKRNGRASRLKAETGMSGVVDSQYAHTGAHLRVDLLGVPRISWNGRPLTLARRQARAILFRLAYADNPVGREELADLLWPDKEPAAARRNLVRLLSFLRSEIPNRDLLLTERTAVSLDPTQFSSDVQDFIRLSSSPSQHDWQQAAALYRGPFLAGFVLSDSPAFDEWQQSTGYDLERKYLEILRQLVNKSTAAGDIAQAIDYANRYLASDDLAETIHCSLITLYAATGKRTAALQQYSRCVEILHHELGVEPLPETRAAFEAARDGAPVPMPRPILQPNWSTLPGLDLPLTGREDEWHALEKAYRQRQSGGAILISGPPGIGKSRLMQEFASAQSAIVLVGNCYTGSQALSFQPLLQVLRQVLLGADQTDLVKPIWLAELSVLLPELREQNPDLPPPLHLAPGQDQTRLLEAITQIFRSLAAPTHLLLCLDDLHAVDEGTLAWLHYVTGHLCDSRICLLVTFRAIEAQILAEWRRLLNRAGLGSQIPLQALKSAPVEALLLLAGADEQAAVELAPRLHEATGGNAFFLLETVRELLEREGLKTVEPVVPLPQTVREAVLRRADRLAPLARQIVDIAAVTSPLLQLQLLAQASARSEMEVAGVIDDLVQRQFLLPEDGRFRFQHDLTREAIYGAISDWRLRLLHKRAAETIEMLPSAAQQGLLGEVARHYELAGDFEQAHIRYRDAAGAAQIVYAYQDAIGFLRRAIGLLSTVQALDDSTESSLYELLADLLMLLGDYDPAREVLGQSLLTLAVNNPFSEARLHYKIGRIWSSQYRFDEALHAFSKAEEILQTAQDHDCQEWHKNWLDIKLAEADLFYMHNRWHEMSRICSALQEPIGQHGTLRQQADFYSTLVMQNNRQLRFTPSENSVAYARHALAIAEQLADRSLIAWKTFSVGFQLLWLGNLAEAEHMISQSLAHAEEISDISLQNRAITYLIIVLRLEGNEAEVLRLVQQAQVSTEDEGNVIYMGAAEANSAWLAYCSGRLNEAEMSAHKAIKRWENLAYPLEWLARLPLLAIALQRGDLETAVDHAKQLISQSQQRLPDPLHGRLKMAADQSSERDGQSIIEDALKQAVTIAEEQGYL